MLTVHTEVWQTDVQRCVCQFKSSTERLSVSERAVLEVLVLLLDNCHHVVESLARVDGEHANFC